jgi:hypothetical protein
LTGPVIYSISTDAEAEGLEALCRSGRPKGDGPDRHGNDGNSLANSVCDLHHLLNLSAAERIKSDGIAEHVMVGILESGDSV